MKLEVQVMEYMNLCKEILGLKRFSLEVILKGTQQRQHPDSKYARVDTCDKYYTVYVCGGELRASLNGVMS
jgi:hypothetical protein